MKKIYSKDRYVIYSTTDAGYVVQNILMEGFAHTHIDNLETAKYIVRLSIKKKLPRDLTRYLTISLLRINNDERYCRRIKEQLAIQRKQIYININKGVRK